MNESLIWTGIIFCISQSAIFSGLNLAFFSLTRLRLEIEVEAARENGSEHVLALRGDSNFLLTTILWGNVGINVLLTLLTDSVLFGAASFLFSTFAITIFGEILPQAYFSRNALKMASRLAPVVKFYQILLYPVAKPCALILDSWLGKESSQFLSEDIIALFIKKHVEDRGSEIDRIEGTGAINFLHLDDLPVVNEAEEINRDSIITLETKGNAVVFPVHKSDINDPFIQKINSSEEKWIIFTDDEDRPRLVLDADGFIRAICSHDGIKEIRAYCHKPILVKDIKTDLAALLNMMRANMSKNEDAPIDHDIALIWNEDTKRIITGADIFGRLLKGI
ncbi:MAG: CNNM domain-containing protein [bacterium]|nr:CNNM domain-containing protein [bacterium]